MDPPEKIVSVFVFHSDLRVKDNLAFIACCRESDIVFPMFIMDGTPPAPEACCAASVHAFNFVAEALKALQRELSGRISLQGQRSMDSNDGAVDDDTTSVASTTESSTTSSVIASSGLYLGVGGVDTALKEFMADHPEVTHVHCTARETVGTCNREAVLQKACDELKLVLVTTRDGTLYQPASVWVQGRMANSIPTFAQFFDKCRMYDVTRPLQLSPRLIPLGTLRTPVALQRARWATVERLIASRRAAPNTIRPNVDLLIKGVRANTGSAELLGAHITHGVVSPRTIYHAAFEARGPSHPIVRHLMWREFYYHIATLRPETMALPPGVHMHGWRTPGPLANGFKQWQRANTNVQSVDQSMTKLGKQGYASHTERMEAARFLVHNLRVPWWFGDQHFRKILVDYDPVVCRGNWLSISHHGLRAPSAASPPTRGQRPPRFFGAPESDAQPPSPCVVPDVAPEPGLQPDSAPRRASGRASGRASKRTPKCAHCRRKVGLLGFVCKCKRTFCSTHRHAELHQCSFDHMAHGRAVLKRSLPEPMTKREHILGQLQ